MVWYCSWAVVVLRKVRSKDNIGLAVHEKYNLSMLMGFWSPKQIELRLFHPISVFPKSFCLNSKSFRRNSKSFRPNSNFVSPQLKVVSPQLKVISPQLKLISSQLKVVSPPQKLFRPKIFHTI